MPLNTFDIERDNAFILVFNAVGLKDSVDLLLTGDVAVEDAHIFVADTVPARYVEFQLKRLADELQDVALLIEPAFAQELAASTDSERLFLYANVPASAMKALSTVTRKHVKLSRRVLQRSNFLCLTKPDNENIHIFSSE